MQRTDRETLWVVAVGDVDPSVPETAAAAAREVLDVDARVHPHPIGTDDYEEAEPPYNGLDLARYARLRTGRGTVLAVTGADVEKPRGDWAFGLAEVGGSVGVVSTARLGEPEEGAFVQRVRTEAVQHAGYLVGMDACHTGGCVFTVASTLADVDRRGATPCDRCRDELRDLDSPLLPARSDDGADSAPTGTSAGAESPDDLAEPVDDAPSESTHDLASAARFWIAVGGFAVCWFAALLLLVRLADWLPIGDVTESDALTWGLLAASVLLGWLLYRKVRSLVGRLGRAAVARARATLSG